MNKTELLKLVLTTDNKATRNSAYLRLSSEMKSTIKASDIK